MYKNSLKRILQKGNRLIAKKHRLAGTTLFFLIVLLLQANAQNLLLENVTVSDKQTYSAQSITAGPDFTVTNSGDATFYSETMVIKPEFFVILGGQLNIITGTPPSAIESTEIQVPDKFAVYQNYPNPFNPETEINFDLPKAGYVTLTIYNTLGQKVRTLLENQFAAGSYTAKWDGKDAHGSYASSGIYIYKLQADSFSDVKKMSLIR